MISRSALAKGGRLAARQPQIVQRRCFAAAATTPSFAFEQADVSGVKVAARDSKGPTARLALVAKAGTRYQPAPGLTVGLEEFAFKNTSKRSALRITREVELLGGQLTSFHTREALVLQASFLRDDLPYFAELLAEVISDTRYAAHIFHEDVERVMHLKQAAIAKDASALALDAAHTLAFHTGLGATLYPTASTPLPSLNEASIAKFASSVYAKNNIALVADGTSSSTLARWTDQFFEDVPSTSSTAVTTTPSKYHGGESRIAHPGDNAMVIAFPGFAYTAPKAELAVLAALLGGESSIKWTPGFTLLAKATAGTTGLSAKAKALSYSDAGLLTVTLSGPAAAVKKAAEDTVAALKSVAAGTVSKEDLTKAIAKAKFDSLDETQLTSTGLALAGSTILHTGKALQPLEAIKGVESVTADKLKAAAKALLDGKATVATVGDLHVLPFAEDLGLKV